MAVWVSLLRGINLGARNKVSMPALREALVEAGFDDVRTYVQSGNVVTRSAHRSPARVAQQVREVVAERFDIDTPVIVRSPKQLAAVRAWNPFPEAAAADPKLVQVWHLSGPPDPAAVQALLAADVEPDAFAAEGNEIVVHYAGGMHASKADRVLRRQSLGVDATARNWRTLNALCDMTGVLTRD
jgi:uncharacterized protein (DUF1697 family)